MPRASRLAVGRPRARSCGEPGRERSVRRACTSRATRCQSVVLSDYAETLPSRHRLCCVRTTPVRVDAIRVRTHVLMSVPACQEMFGTNVRTRSKCVAATRSVTRSTRQGPARETGSHSRAPRLGVAGTGRRRRRHARALACRLRRAAGPVSDDAPRQPTRCPPNLSFRAQPAKRAESRNLLPAGGRPRWRKRFLRSVRSRALRSK